MMTKLVAFTMGLIALFVLSASLYKPHVANVVVNIPVPAYTEAPAWSDKEVQCLARTIDAEARGEPLVGQLAVATVVLNRSISPGFPKNICAVTTQHSQFASRNSSKKALAIAQFAVDHANFTFRLLPQRAMYFHSGAKTKTMYGHPFVMTIKHHHFYA